ncbi:unnamed protein product [Calypogeia fissa]
MGDYAGSALENYNPKLTAGGEDMTVAKDIAKRFEQLESQWLHFQKKSDKWEGETRLAAEQTLPNNCELDRTVPSTAFSYSNPLFSSHKTIKRRSAGNSPRASLSSARSSVTSLLPSHSADKGFSTRHRQRMPLIPSSERHSSLAAQPTNSVFLSSSVSTRLTNSQSTKKCPGPHDVPRANGNLTHPIAPLDKMASYLPIPIYATPSKPPPSSSSAHSFSVHSEQQTRAAILLESPVDSRNCRNPHSAFQSKLPIHECTTGNMWSSSVNSPGAFTSSKPPTPDPVTYSSGKGPPGLQIAGGMEELGSPEVAQSSRSPPPVTPSASSARDTELQSDGSTFEPGTNLRSGGQKRNHSMKMPDGNRVMSQEASNNKSHSSQIIPEDSRSATERMIGLRTTDYGPVFGGKTFKPDSQMGWKDRKEISVLVQHKLDHTISKVEWELRLSKRESKLRVAEETLLEEQQKLSEARLALSKCEDNLSHREEAVCHLEQVEAKKRDLEVTLENVESGTMVMGKLVAALRDVLTQMDKKERALHEMWNELKQACDNEFCRDQLFGFDPNKPRAMGIAIDLEEIHLLAANGDSKEWCKIVINVCERLVGFLSRETHLQKWAVVLERESARMKSLEEEIMNTKEATAEQFERAAEMMRCAKEQTRMAEEERTTLSKERASLVLWVSHLQERRKAVSECEQEAAASMAEVQKKAANLSVHESSIDGKALEICALQEELWATSVRLHTDQELVNKERVKVQERIRQVSARERDAESQLHGIKRLKEELEKQTQQFEKDKMAEVRKQDRANNLQRDLEARLSARELTLREIESELEEKALAAESLAAQLNEREKLLKSVHEHCEIERVKTKESMADLERERTRIKDSEEAIVEAHAAKKNADEAWARVSKERREADEYLKSVEDRVKAWEDRLQVKEKELQQQQFSLRGIESRIQEERDSSEALHSKLILEQETWTEELKAKQDSLAKRTKILECKEAEIKIDLQKLAEERRLAINEIKRFAEMEARAWAAERELQTKHEEHSQEVRKHEKEYRAQIEELEIARREVEKEFEEVHTQRDELQIWQRDAEETVQSRIESFTNGKEELQIQIQELKKLQVDIEQAGAQIIDRVAELDQASSKLELQRNKVELSKRKVEALARNLAQQQELLKSRESTLVSQEEKIASALSDVKRMTAETAAQEKNVKLREQAVVDRERDLQELEGRLTDERGDLEKMITEVEQHAAALKEETASAEEISHKERLIEEKRQENLAKEKELLDYEGTLKKKARSLEEHSHALSKLEQQVQDRLNKSEDIEKGWEKLREEQVAFETQRDFLKSQKEDAQQWKAEQDRKAREDAQRKARLREDLDRQKTELLSKLQEREHALQVRESRLAEREESIQVLERQGKSHIHKDAQELRAQLNGARAELDAQTQYVEEKRRVAEAIAATIEEREARLTAKEKEFEDRETALEERERKCLRSSEVEQHNGPKWPAADSDSYALDYRQAHGGQAKWKTQIPGKEMDESLHRMVTFDRMDNLQEPKQADDATRRRLKQMEDIMQKEAVKIAQERANLKAQQQELEETRKAVQDVKETLITQLKATKQMVADAAQTAQNASREREALEEERRRLEKLQKDTETSVAEKEAKLLNEAKYVESIRASLFQEKTHAMEVLQKAARLVEQERVKAIETTAFNKERQAEAELKEREKQLSQTAEQLHREKVSIEEEKARLKRLHEVLERDKYDQPQVQFQPTLITEAQNEPESRKQWEEPHRWREERTMHDLHGFHQISKMHNQDVNISEHSPDCTISFYQQAGHNQNLGAIGETSGRHSLDYIPGPAERRRQSGTGTNTSWDDLFNGSLLLSSPESSMAVGPGVHHMSPEKRTGDTCAHHHDDNSPSKRRLENVMKSLIDARAASRSRLQRTENALLGFPSTSPFTTQIQKALNDLSSRLALMEKIEDGLATNFRKAYEMDSPGSDCLIVDKVQLLCRMEEQQNLRAEWEEDMQEQLETISMLQAASRSSTFTSPVKGSSTLEKVQSMSPPFDWPVSSSGDAKHGQQHVAQESEITRRPGMTATNSGSSGSNASQSPPEWKMAFEPLLGVDSNGLSYSPLVDYNYYPNCNQNSNQELRGKEHDGSEKFARRKLHLSPPTSGHVGPS